MDELVSTVVKSPDRERPVDHLPLILNSHNHCVSLEMYNRVVKDNSELELKLEELRRRYICVLEQFVKMVQQQTQTLDL